MERERFEGYVDVFRSSSLANYLSGDFYFKKEDEKPAHLIHRLPKQIRKCFNESRGAKKLIKVTFVASKHSTLLYNIRGVKILEEVNSP